MRGVHLKRNTSETPKRLTLFFHGNKSYLPDKIPFFQEMSTQLQTDVIGFNYRGYGVSDGAHPHNEEIVHVDILAITDFFKKTAKPD